MANVGYARVSTTDQDTALHRGYAQGLRMRFLSPAAP